MKYIIRVVIASLFIGAGVSKLIVIGTLISEIHQYQIVPNGFETIAAMIVVWPEIIFGLLLLINKKTTMSIYVLAGLLILFLLAKTSTMIRGIDLTDCFCFGTLLKLPLWASGILNASLLLGLYHIWKR